MRVARIYVLARPTSRQFRDPRPRLCSRVNELPEKECDLASLYIALDISISVTSFFSFFFLFFQSEVYNRSMLLDF